MRAIVRTAPVRRPGPSPSDALLTEVELSSSRRAGATPTLTRSGSSRRESLGKSRGGAAVRSWLNAIGGLATKHAPGVDKPPAALRSQLDSLRENSASLARSDPRCQRRQDLASTSVGPSGDNSSAMAEPVTTALGLAVAKAAAGKAGSKLGQTIWTWARGSEAKQLVKRLEKDHPAAATMLLQPDVISELWVFAETGALDAPAMKRALRPLTNTEEEAEALTEAIRSEQWRTIREERRTHFELLTLRDDLRAADEVQVDQIVERIERLLEESKAQLPRARQLSCRRGSVRRSCPRARCVREAPRRIQPHGCSRDHQHQRNARSRQVDRRD